jgi:ADP-ribose pyrophosphatase
MSPTPSESASPAAVTQLERRLLVSTRVFQVAEHHLRLPSGLEQRLALVEHPGAVAIAARFPDGRLALVRQYRHAARDWLLEVPAGRLEPGEAPLIAAQRELAEETGLTAKTWRPLKSFFAAPGFCSEILHLFLATDLTALPADRRPAADHDEELSLELRHPSELLAGGCQDAKSLLAAALLLLEPSSA